MKPCSVTGCRGAYEARRITHLMRTPEGTILVVDQVPAEVCELCGDTLFTVETVEHLEAMLKNPGSPVRMVPLYEYA